MLAREAVCATPRRGGGRAWEALWGALAHQGDVFSASFAAVPHLVAALAGEPARAHLGFLQLPAWVEICRARKRSPVPRLLRGAYRAALAELAPLAAQAAARARDPGALAVALAAVAAARGQPTIAEVLIELTPEVAEELRGWLELR